MIKKNDGEISPVLKIVLPSLALVAVLFLVFYSFTSFGRHEAQTEKSQSVSQSLATPSSATTASHHVTSVSEIPQTTTAAQTTLPITSPTALTAASTTLPVTATKPVTSSVPQTTTTVRITSAAPVTSVATTTTTAAPVVTTVTTERVDDRVPGIAWTSEETPLYNDSSFEEELVRIESETAVILVEENDGYCIIKTLGREFYVRTDSLSPTRPESARELMKTNGGIYYKGVKGLVAIDAGHQGKGMNGLEPNGPGSTDMKKMLSTGTQGVATRIPEYVLNLEVALRLRNELIARGYSVVMIRESHNVTISNVGRAKIANAYKADIFVRIHANGSTDKNANGAFGICMTEKNPYNAALFEKSLKLSSSVTDAFCEKTGIARLAIWQTDTMTGINWAEIPVTIFEMGYMSNPDEDRLMATDDFRNKAAEGIADGIDRYFAE